MARGYSNDLRERLIAIVQDGESAREAARLLNVGASTAIRWIERWTKTGSIAAKPGTGHTCSPLKRHEQWLLALVAEEPDLTLQEIRARLAAREEDEVRDKLDLGILRSSQRYLQKKLYAPPSRIVLTSRPHAPNSKPSNPVSTCGVSSLLMRRAVRALAARGAPRRGGAARTLEDADLCRRTSR